MKLIDDFTHTEELKMTWLDKLVRNYPRVRTTKSISYPLADLQFDKEKLIRPSVWDKFTSLIVLSFLGIVWVGLFKMLWDFKSPIVVSLAGLLLVTVLIFILLRNSFFSKKYIYDITVDAEGIAIDNRKILWTEILETCIMNRQEGRYTNYYLIIFKKDKTIEKLNLFRIAITDRKLSTIIEYYKTKAA